ncbi:MAG: hypothetical protein GX472_00120 [Methanomicrobiales archaeon]|jgi:hypothetical protein|nr:hypothetical protein [Methanomicrobiales archaeon]
MQDIAEILGLVEVQLIEPSFALLPDTTFTALLEESEGTQARLLVDQDSDPLCMAVCREDGTWIAGCFHLRPPTGALIARFEYLGGDIFQEERGIWEAAVRGYYSRELALHTTPALEDLNPGRVSLVDSLVGEILGDGAGRSCLDCGCGSGVGSLVLRKRGYKIFSCDNDPSLISLGFARGRLLQEETMLIDASLLHHYVGHCDTGLGLMFGEIHDFNEGMWEQITGELIMLTDRSLITTGTEQEAMRIRNWADQYGKESEIIENTRDPIYDRWICSISS